MNDIKFCFDYFGHCCVNGSCPMAKQEEYAERCYDVVYSCKDCIHYGGCEDCAMPFYSEISLENCKKAHGLFVE